MTHICCPMCGNKLIVGNDGKNISTKCQNCKAKITTTFDEEKIHLVFSHLGLSIMKILVSCPKCGNKLIDGTDGNGVNIKCHRCKAETQVSFNSEEMHLIFKAFEMRMLKKAAAN